MGISHLVKMNKAILISSLFALPHAVLAQDITCTGADPDWSLILSDTSATFAFDRTTEMQIMQDDTAQNDDSVRAMTLVGPRDSAIVIHDKDTGAATILTQRGQSPIILSGACD